jgi:hypothetical protein
MSLDVILMLPPGYGFEDTAPPEPELVDADPKYEVIQQGVDEIVEVPGVKERFRLENLGAEESISFADATENSGSLSTNDTGDIIGVTPPTGYSIVEGGEGVHYVIFEADVEGDKPDMQLQSGTADLTIEPQGSEGTPAQEGVKEVFTIDFDNAVEGSLVFGVLNGNSTVEFDATDEAIDLETKMEAATSEGWSVENVVDRKFQFTRDVPGHYDDTSIQSHTLKKEDA